GIASLLAYPGLIHVDIDGSVEHLLAERMEISPDGNRIELQLRKGRFQDGTEITAERVVSAYRAFPAGLHPQLDDARECMASLRAVAEDRLVVERVASCPRLMEALELGITWPPDGTGTGAGDYVVAHKSAEEIDFAATSNRSGRYDHVILSAYAN